MSFVNLKGCRKVVNQTHDTALYLRKAVDKMSEILKEGGEARNFSVSLHGSELSSELVHQMQQHADFMTRVYQVLQKLTKQKVNSAAVYDPIINKVNERMEWYKLRKVRVHTSL